MTANVEANEHFAREADALKLAKTSEENLLDATAGEQYEYTKMYKEFAKQARHDGDLAAAKLFEQIAEDEGDHYSAYMAMKGIIAPTKARPDRATLQPLRIGTVNASRRRSRSHV